MKCPKLYHTKAGRERALKYTNQLTNLHSDQIYTYKLHHYYDSQPCDVYVKTDIEPVVFELLLSHILFEASEIDKCYALGQEEIDQPILKELFGVEVLAEPVETDEVFDLYYTWEKWCALYGDVQGVNILKHEELKAALEQIIPVAV